MNVNSLDTASKAYWKDDYADTDGLSNRHTHIYRETVN